MIIITITIIIIMIKKKKQFSDEIFKWVVGLIADAAASYPDFLCDGFDGGF